MSEDKTTDEKTEDTETESRDVSPSKVKEFVSGLTDEQLATVKSTVDSEAGKREVPNYGNMTDAELREHCRKKHGFSPI